MKQPMQLLIIDKKGAFRFKKNAIVKFLLDNGPYNMNDIAVKDFSQEDREQFAQLIGYSLSGYSELSYVTDETYEVAVKMTEGKSELEARYEHASEKLAEARKLLKELVPIFYRIHPDDLEE